MYSLLAPGERGGVYGLECPSRRAGDMTAGMTGLAIRVCARVSLVVQDPSCDEPTRTWVCDGLASSVVSQITALP